MGNDYQWRFRGLIVIIMGARGKIVDVIHGSPFVPKVPIIFLGYYGLNVEISLKYGARSNNRVNFYTFTNYIGD